MKRKRKKNNANIKPPGYRRKLLADLKKQYPYYNLKSNILGGLFLSGIGLTIWEIDIYRVTFISLYIPMSIWILTGLIMTPIFKKTFNIYCFNPYSPGQTQMFFHYFYNIVAFGGILVFLFMWTNQNFTDKTKRVVNVGINSYGHLAKSKGSCGEPYVVINYKDSDKELFFSCDTGVEKYGLVYIEVEKGFFGYDIITNKTLTEGQW